MDSVLWEVYMLQEVLLEVYMLQNSIEENSKRCHCEFVDLEVCFYIPPLCIEKGPREKTDSAPQEKQFAHLKTCCFMLGLRC